MATELVALLDDLRVAIPVVIALVDQPDNIGLRLSDIVVLCLVDAKSDFGLSSNQQNIPVVCRGEGYNKGWSAKWGLSDIIRRYVCLVVCTR